VIRVIMLDSGPLGLISNSRGGEATRHCNRWLDRLRDNGVRIVISAIVEFEVRRELVLAGRRPSIAVLNEVVLQSIYAPVTEDVVLRASELWAESRRKGRPTADPLALDADVLIAAQAACLEDEGFDVVVATFNAAHVGRYVPAKSWTEIEPEENDA